MSDFICINDRNQLPKYIPGYDTPEEAEAASKAMSACSVKYVTGTDAFAGPGSYLKSITLVPTSLTPAFTLSLNSENMILWDNSATYTELPSPVSLHICAANSSGSISFSTLTGRAIVTGYFTPVT